MKSCISSASNIEIGGYIKFGKYMHNSTNHNKDDIEWLILDIKDNEALIISKYALDCKKFHSYTTSVAWKECTIREWLNGVFFNAAFSDVEKSAIVSVEIMSNKKANFNEISTYITRDNVFLLSINEAITYLVSDYARQCKPTNYATTQGAFVNDSTGFCWWWLRSQGDNQYDASYVYTSGYICKHGHNVRDDFTCVRPAIRININIFNSLRTACIA